MRKTDQYQLNQWELSDRVRMEDFNADNAKLEAALAGKLGRMELIYTPDMSQHNGKDHLSCFFGFGLVGKRWEDWECVITFLDVHKTAFKEKDTYDISFAAEPDPSASFVTIFDDIILKPDSVAVVLFPMHDGNSPIRGFLVGGGGKTLCSDYPISILRNMMISVRVPGEVTTTRFVEPKATVYGIR